MNNEREAKLNELIDCCRRAEDLTLPELTELAAAQSDPEVDRRLRKALHIDALVRQSIREVPIPEGLEDRLLAAIANPSPSSVESASEVNLPSPDVTAGSPSPTGLPDTGPRKGLQTWKVWATGLASVAAIVLIVVMSQYGRVRGPNTESEVAAEVAKWMNNLDESAWSREFELPSVQYPLPSQLRLLTPYSWQKVSNTSLNVACYNIPNKNSRLFVCQGASGQSLPSQPPSKPTTVTVSGWVVGSWKSNGFIYALAVKGTEQHYRMLTNGNSRIASL
jgi:hypothetical protein